MRVTVSDHGHWREKRDSDRGRGLDLIRGLMDEVEVIPGDDGTTVKMRKRLSAPVALPSESPDGPRRRKRAAAAPR